MSFNIGSGDIRKSVCGGGGGGGVNVRMVSKAVSGGMDNIVCYHR